MVGFAQPQISVKTCLVKVSKKLEGIVTIIIFNKYMYLLMLHAYDLFFGGGSHEHKVTSVKYLILVN